MTKNDWEDMGRFIGEAESTGKWLFTSYQQLWFSPSELRSHQANGRFRWGVVNWQLRDPRERLDQFDRDENNARFERSQFVKRVASERQKA